jgi:general secretion pathway protein H
MRGVTLMELILVLVLLAVMGAVAAPRVGKSIGTLDQRNAAQKVSALFKAARNDAVAQRKETVVAINTKALTITGHEREAVKLPSGVALDLTTIEKEKIDEESAGIRFYPDGGSTGGRVTIKQGGRALRIDVDWLTGRVKVTEEAVNA